MAITIINEQTEEFALEILQVDDQTFSFDVVVIVGSGGTSLTAQTLGDTIAAATEKTEPADTDVFVLSDSEDIVNPDIAKQITWASIKTALIASFSLLYAAIGHNHDLDYATRSHNHDMVYAALGHNHAGVYDPAGTAASAVSTHEGSLPHYSALASMSDDSTHRLVTDTEKSTWNGKADGNHNHSGVYDPAGTASGLIGTHENNYNHTGVNGISTPTDSYQLVVADAGKMIRMNKATANNLTVPLNTTAAIPVNTQIIVKQAGAGQTTIVAEGGVTINSVGGRLKLATQYSGCVLTKIDTNIWTCDGDLIL